MSLLIEESDTSEARYQPDDLDMSLPLSPESKRAYLSDVVHFVAHTRTCLPTTVDRVCAYLKANAECYSIRTLRRRLAHIRLWHDLRDLPDPTKDKRIMKEMKNLAREYGKPKNQARAVRLDDIKKIVAHLSIHASLKNVRNRAMLLIGYYGAFRRSELVNLRWENIDFRPEGLLVTLPKSKTDQTGEGLHSAIPYAEPACCPVKALMSWQERVGRYEGPVFPRITKHGKILDTAVSDNYWNRAIRQMAIDAKVMHADQITSHSLRRGSTTEAAYRGAPMKVLMDHGRWRSATSVVGYLAEAGRFQECAGSYLAAEEQ